MTSAAALATPTHLACIEGPDRGIVLALHQRTSLGRSANPQITDLHTPRAGITVSFARHGRKERAVVTLQRGRSRPLRPGRRIVIGRNLWEMRRRPRDLQWRFPAKQKWWSVWVRFIPLVFIVALLWRFTRPEPSSMIGVGWSAISVAVGAILISKLRLRRRFDPGFLQLAFAGASTQKAHGAWEGPLVWEGPVGGKRLSVDRGSVIGVFGENSRAHALWIATQLSIAASLPLVELATPKDPPSEDSSQSSGPCVWVTECRRQGRETRRSSSAIRSSEDGSSLNALSQVGGDPGLDQGDQGLDQGDHGRDQGITVAWSQNVESLPPNAVRVISAGPVRTRPLVSPKWTPLQPEEDSESDCKLPKVDCSPAATLDRWQRRARDLRVVIGHSAAGPVTIDIAGDGPHALIAGGTGSGKSVALRTWLTQMALQVSPRDLHIVLVDFKGGAGLGSLQDLPHVVQFSTDLDRAQSAWLLRQVNRVMDDRKRALREAGYTDLAEWEVATHAAPPRILLVIDEFQALGEDEPEFLPVLARLASQGRSLGIHLLLSTQHPGPALTPTLRASVDLRVVLRCNEAADSTAMIGSDAAYHLPRTPGMAIANGKTFRFLQVQVPRWPQFPSGTSPWPAPLPATTDQPVGVAVIAGALSPLQLGTQPLLLAGPAGSGRELAAHARHIAKREAKQDGRDLVLMAPHMPPGDLASALDHAGPGQVLLMIELAAILRELEIAGVGLEAIQVWSRLVTASPSQSPRIIVTDSEGHPKAARLGTRLLRIPHEGAWKDPALLRVAPQLPAFTMSVAVDELVKEEATNPTPGRFVATGLPQDHRPRVVQLATIDATNPQETEVDAPRFAPTAITRADLVVGDERLAKHLGAEYVPPQRWLHALTQGEDATYFPSPSLEVVRHIASRSRSKSLWVKARYPYPPEEGLLVRAGIPQWASHSM